jgi:hypothetical protein
MNIAQAIMHLFPQANHMNDFIVQDDSDGMGQWIAQWNLEEPQPTEEELQAAWDAMQPTEEQLLDQAKQNKISELSANCNKAILAGFSSSALGAPHFYGYEIDDQANFEKAMNLIIRGKAPAQDYWKTKNAGPLVHTQAQIELVYDDSIVHLKTNLGKKWMLEAKVKALTTAEAIEAIVW